MTRAVGPSHPDLTAAQLRRDATDGEFVCLPTRMRLAFALLLQSHEYAQQLGQDLWDFGVELFSLRELGLTNNDLRWMTCQGFVEHAREITNLGDDRREFRPTGRMNLTQRSCFVLTPPGAEVARKLACQEPSDRQSPQLFAWESRPEVDVNDTAPVFDCDRREFRVGRDVVKRFKLPSPNQEIILTAFQEEGWPPRIDDPLPPTADCDPKQRLRDTIKSLNRSHKVMRVRFKGDGTGQGVLWEYVNGQSDATASP